MKVMESVRLGNLMLWIWLMTAGSTIAAELLIQVVPLRYRTAEQLLPLLEPLVNKPGTVSGSQGDLIIRASRSNLADIMKVLGTLDRAPRRLLITVRHDAPGDQSADGTALQGDRAASGRRVYGTGALANDRHAQRLHVDEGSEATIHVGQFVPVTSRRTVRRIAAGRVWEDTVEATEYRDVLTGFTVKPRLLGDVVSLELIPQLDTSGTQGRRSMHVQRLATTVSGRLGEWIELGAVLAGDAVDSGASSYGTRSVREDTRRILVRVDAID